MSDQPNEVGRVLRASTMDFTVGVRKLQQNLPRFGALIRVQTDSTTIYGLIYDVLIDDDPFVRQLLAARDLRDEEVKDQRENRLVPAEVSVLAIGYGEAGTIYHLLPPQPPAALDMVYQCDDAEVKQFGSRLNKPCFDYFRLILQSQGIPADELLAASLREGARVRGSAGQQYLIDAGRELARILAIDPVRLDNILRRLHA
jgi:hypothetical protein